MIPGRYEVKASHTTSSPLVITPNIADKTFVVHVHPVSPGGTVFARSSGGAWQTVTGPIELAVAPGDTLDLASPGAYYRTLNVAVDAAAAAIPRIVEVSVRRLA